MKETPINYKTTYTKSEEARRESSKELKSPKHRTNSAGREKKMSVADPPSVISSSLVVFFLVKM